MNLLLIASIILIVILISMILISLAKRNLIFPSVSSRMFSQNRPSFTAELVNSFRAIGTFLGYCNDPFAFEFSSLDVKIFILLYSILKKILKTLIPLGSIANLSARTRYFDEFVIESSSTCKQFVILGAGFDSRGYRLKCLDNLQIFEVDALSTQKLKYEKVKETFQYGDRKLFTCRAYEKGLISYVDCNFKQESFLNKLNEKGFNQKEGNTFFLLEGVASYLTWDELKSTLLLVANCAKGTKIGFNVLVDVNYMQNSLFSRLSKRAGEERKFALSKTETPESVFEPLGFKILKSNTFSEIFATIPEFEHENLRNFPSKLIIMEVV